MTTIKGKQKTKKGFKSMESMLEMGTTPTQALKQILKQAGYYAFNRYCRNLGLRLEYVLYIHRLSSAKKA